MHCFFQNVTMFDGLANIDIVIYFIFVFRFKLYRMFKCISE